MTGDARARTAPSRRRWSAGSAGRVGRLLAGVRPTATVTAGVPAARPPTRRRLAGIALGVVLTAATGPGARALAVTGGAPDGTGHPFVAMLLLPGASFPTCTGTLVRGDAGTVVVLTDGHCLYRGGRHTGTGVRVTFDASWTSTPHLYTGIYYVHPRYQPPSKLHDLAAVVVAGTLPAPARLASVDAVPAMAGSTAVTVGTGGPFSGQRRAATEQVTSHDPSWLYLKPGDGNSCDGDSGGPDLDLRTEAVLALTDQGSCSYDQDTRLDTADGHWFATAAPTWATAAPHLSLALSSATVARGRTVTAWGSTSGLYSGETVYRQGYYAGGWHTWASAVVGPTGRYAFTVTPTVPTYDYYRVYLPASATHPAGASPTVRLLVS